MKRMVIAYICMALAYNPAYADCDFSRDVKKQDENTYTYTKDCHIEVGKKINSLEKREAEVVELRKTIELKDLALTKADQRIDMWRDATFKIEDRANTMEQIKKNNELLYLGLGVVLTGLAVWGAGQLQRH